LKFKVFLLKFKCQLRFRKITQGFGGKGDASRGGPRPKDPRKRDCLINSNSQ
jgi:hypothetical protein